MATKYGIRNAPPLFLYIKYGNLKKEPKPTAKAIINNKYS